MTVRLNTPALALALSASCIAAALASPSAHAAEGPTLTGDYTWTENFDSPDALQSWTTFNIGDYNAPERIFWTPDNVAVEDGHLVITTRRHCVTGEEKPSDANHHPDPCPAGTTTKYTTGRVRSPQIARGTFTVNVTAKLDLAPQAGVHPSLSLPVPGVRSAIWMQNDEKSCSYPGVSEYGELDLLEHYTDPRGGLPRSLFVPANTHIGCGDKSNHRAERDAAIFGAVQGKPLTWTVEASPEKVAYSVTSEDGKVVPVNYPSYHYRGETIPDAGPNTMGAKGDQKLDPELFARVLNRPYSLTLNQYVTTAAWQGLPQDDKPFPDMRMLVDKVEVKGHYDAPAEPPAPTPTPTPSPAPGDKGSAQGSSTGSTIAGVLAGLVGVIGVVAALVRTPALAPVCRNIAAGLPSPAREAVSQWCS